MKRLFKICALGLWASLAWSLWFDQAFALTGLLCFVLLAVFSKPLFFQDIFKNQQPLSSHRIPWDYAAFLAAARRIVLAVRIRKTFRDRTKFRTLGDGRSAAAEHFRTSAPTGARKDRGSCWQCS